MSIRRIRMKKLIYGMSKKRKDLAAWIEDHTFQTMVALAQLYLFPTGNRVHWRKEVWEKFSRMYPFRKTNKLPDAQFILDNSWEVDKKWVGNALQHAKDREDAYIPRKGATYDEFYQIAEDYFTWLADRLSQSNQISLQEVKDELDRLGLDEVIV